MMYSVLFIFVPVSIVSGFIVSPYSTFSIKQNTCIGAGAGGFEWEDPIEAFDQEVENPFKNNEFDFGDDNFKVDPARLLSPRLQGSNLYFVGMMGCGKTSVANSLARRMGTYNFLDTDTIVESVTKTSISEIFKNEGEESFRAIEAQVLDSVHAYVRCVIGTGGGIVCRLQNWSKLQTGIVIWLDVSPELIISRIGKDPNRPLLQKDDPLLIIKALLEERKKLYNQADVRIEVTEEMNVDDTVNLIIRELHDFIDENPPAWEKVKAKAQEEGLDWVQ